jgi:hypothetical protein
MTKNEYRIYGAVCTIFCLIFACFSDTSDVAAGVSIAIGILGILSWGRYMWLDYTDNEPPGPLGMA